MLMQDSKDDETLSWVLLAGMIEQSKKGAQKLSLRTKPCCVAFQISVNELYSDLVFFLLFCKMKFKNFFLMPAWLLQTVEFGQFRLYVKEILMVFHRTISKNPKGKLNTLETVKRITSKSLSVEKYFWHAAKHYCL